MPNTPVTAIAIFALTIFLTFVFSVLGRMREVRGQSRSVSSQGLNRWVVGLSAGAAANSGFIVAGAVGLGYTAGLHWVALPLAWFAGDLVFWALFPHRINAFGQRIGANTVADIVTSGLEGPAARLIRIVVGVIVMVCLGGYTAAQWLAGEKFVTGAFGLGPNVALLTFGAIIVAYTTIGGFKGSVYTDSYQAVLRLVGTTLALAALISVAMRNPDGFTARIQEAGPAFLDLFPNSTWLGAIGFVTGYAAAAFGFGLGQPQVLTRYMGASSPSEARAAKWIYLFFVQYTWIAMTLFGALLRGVMPNLADGETGLASFFSAFMPQVLTGIIIADIFATIAATSNSLIVAMSQTLRYDILAPGKGQAEGRSLLLPSLMIGLATMAVSLVIDSNVVTMALSSVSIMGAGLAPCVLVRLTGMRHTPSSLLLSILAGTATAILWKLFRLDAALGEAAPGILAGLTMNYLVACLPTRAASL